MIRLQKIGRSTPFSRVILLVGCWTQIACFWLLVLCMSVVFIKQSRYRDMMLNAMALSYVLEVDNKLLVPIFAEKRAKELATYTLTEDKSCLALLWKMAIKAAMLPFAIFDFIVNHTIMNAMLFIFTIA